MPEVLSILPSQCKRIHCWAHLVLLLGVVTSTSLMVDTSYSWYWHGCRESSWGFPCQGRVLPLIFVGCCIFYFIRTIQQYDENLLKKQKDIEQAKDNLAKCYQETVSEMDRYVANSMDTQASLAERSFESKRRDFQRFMQKISRDYKSVGGNCTEAQDTFLLKELRRFVGHWLSVFAECSIDPVARPLVLISEEDLDSCSSVAELAELVSQRAKAAQVRIISYQRERDQKELKGLRGIFQKKRDEHFQKLAARRRSSQRKSMVKDVEVGTLKFGMGVMQQESADVVDHKWFQPCGSKRLCAWDASNAGQDGFPVELHCFRSRIVFLSAEHIQLMVAFIIGFFVLAFEFAMVKTAKIFLACALVVCQICIVFVLYEFIDIDIVQQLENQLKDVQAEQDKLENRRQTMIGFYENAQLLADIWLHRTVPRLELMKQLSDGAEDSGAGQLLPVLTNMNAKLQDLEDSLPALSEWLSNEVMDNNDKNRVGNSLNQLTKAHDVKEVLAWMPQCTRQINQDNKRVKWSNSVGN